MSNRGFTMEGPRPYDLGNLRAKRGGQRVTPRQRYEIQVKLGQGVDAKDLSLEYHLTARYIKSLSPVYL